jgi:hypothetical protein
MDTVEATRNTTSKKRKAHLVLVKTIAEADYIHVPRSNGCVDYLLELEGYKEDINLLGRTYLYDDVIERCLEAFKTCVRADRIEAMRQVENSWIEKRNTLAPATTDATLWSAFKEFYVNEFDKLDEDHILDNRRSRANSVIDSRIADLESRMDANETVVEDIGTAAFSAITRSPPREATSRVPPLVGTDSGSHHTAMSGMTSMNMQDIANAVSAILQNQGQGQMANNSTGQSRGNRNQTGPATATTNSPARVWKQWNKYCHTCGVHCGHDSTSCIRKKPGHKDEATWENKMGGNTKKDHLWMKWCHPTTFQAYDRPE